MVGNRARCDIGVLQPDVPLVIIRIGTAQPVGQEWIQEGIGRGHFQVRQGTGRDVSAMRNSVGELAGRGDVD